MMDLLPFFLHHSTGGSANCRSFQLQCSKSRGAFQKFWDASSRLTGNGAIVTPEICPCWPIIRRAKQNLDNWCLEECQRIVLLHKNMHHYYSCTCVPRTLTALEDDNMNENVIPYYLHMPSASVFLKQRVTIQKLLFEDTLTCLSRKAWGS